ASVRLRSDALDLQPIVLALGVVAEEGRTLVDVDDDHINVAVVVEVSEGRASTAAGEVQIWAAICRDIDELARSLVLVDDLALFVGEVEVFGVNFRKHVAVRHKDVSPAIVIKIKQSHAPAEELRVSAQPSLQNGVVERSIAVIVVNVRRLIGVVGLDDVEPAVAVIVAHRHAHSALGTAILIDGAADLATDLLKRAITLVVIKAAGHGITGDVNVRPSIVVKIGGAHAKAIAPHRQPILLHEGRGSLRPARNRDSRLHGNVFKGSVATIVIKDVRSAAHALRTTANADSVVLAIRRAARLRASRYVKVYVVGHEQVEAPVTVVVDEAAARIPARMAFLRETGFRSDFSKSAVAIVVIKDNLTPISDD